MKIKLISIVAVFASVLLLLGGIATNVRAEPITGLYNTGVNSSGVVLSNGATDSHYTITSSPLGTPTPFARTSAGGWPISPSGPWIGDNTISRWIVPNFSTTPSGFLNHPGGTYQYKLAFDLTGLIPGTASISGRWAADNGGPGTTISLNGVSTGLSNTNGFTGWTSFSISSGFIGGENTLDFIIDNGVTGTGNPTGLRVEMSGTADVPEPSLGLLLGISLIGLVGVGVIRKRFKRGSAL